MSTKVWMTAIGATLVATAVASADIGFSVGASGRSSSFGFSYNQPGWGGRPYHGHHHHHHRGHYHHGHHGHHHHGGGGGWGVSVQSYQPAPRAVIVPAPTYVVPAYGY